MPDWFWALGFGLAILAILALPAAIEDIKHSIAVRREKRGEPIDWTTDHNLKLPLAPYFDPRVEFTEEEAFLDLLEENARLLREVEDKRRLEREVEHQEALKKRYLKELRRVKRRG